MKALLSVLVLTLGIALTSAVTAGDRLEGPARVIDAATIEVAGETLRLYGFVAPGPGERCPYRGTEIDCGQVAASALMDLTAATPVSCTVDDDAARCDTGGYDLSEGMIYTGWALPLRNAPARLRAVLREAAEKGHGLWRGEFPDRVITAAGQPAPASGGR